MVLSASVLLTQIRPLNIGFMESDVGLSYLPVKLIGISVAVMVMMV